MANRQVLPLVDLRTAAQRQGITQQQQNIQAITDILKTVGEAEQKRRERQTLDRIVRVIGEGKTTAEAIAAVAGQGPEFGGGFPGILQRIGGLFQPSQGGIKQNIQQAIIGDALKKALSPQPQIPSGLEPSGVTVGPEGGMTRRFAKPETDIGKLPGWWDKATEKQKQAYIDRVGGPLVQVGQKLLTPQQRQKLADKGFAEEMRLSEAQRNTARRSVKTIVSEMSTRTWTWGTKNYARGNLIQGYKQYRSENDYASKSPKNRKWLDENWDSQMTTYNKAGYKKIGKGEFDWNPKDPKVQALRKATAVEEPGAIEGGPAIAEPQTKTEFINQLRRLNETNTEKARKYYNKHIDKFW